MPKGFIQLGVAAQTIVNKLRGATQMPKDSEDDFHLYRRTQIAEMRPWRPGEAMAGVAVSKVDEANGSPKAGDMIARNPANHDDQWLVAAAYFAANFEPKNRVEDAGDP